MFISGLGLMLVLSGTLGIKKNCNTSYVNFFILLEVIFTCALDLMVSGDFLFGWNMFQGSVLEQIMDLSRFENPFNLGYDYV